MKRRWRNGAILLFLLVAAALSMPALVPPIGPLAAGREGVSERFTRCGQGYSRACVVDGDTFRIGKRRIRILGIDAPELRDPQCAAELALAKRATDELVRQLNDGDIVLVTDRREQRDQYGRELRRVVRHLKNDTDQSIGDEMIRQGLAAPYLGRKASWC